jgi:hypothetical protein
MTAFHRRAFMAATAASVAAPTALGAKECPTMDWITMSLEARGLIANGESRRRRVFRDCSFLALNTGYRALPLRRSAANGDMKMNAQATKLETAENDLKQLMADVTRAMTKAEEAIGRIASQTMVATAENESTTSSR